MKTLQYAAVAAAEIAVQKRYKRHKKKSAEKQAEAEKPNVEASCSSEVGRFHCDARDDRIKHEPVEG